MRSAGSRIIRVGGHGWTPTQDQLDLIATLLEAGVRIEDALATIERSTVAPATRYGSRAVAGRIRAGSSIAVAFEESGASDHVVALLSAGERVGSIADAFRGAATLTRGLEEVRRSVGQALVYPAVVLGIGITMLMLIAIVVVPPLERAYLDLGGSLPRATTVVLSASDLVRSGRIVILVAVGIGLRRPMRRALARTGLHGLSWRLPPLRGITIDLVAATLARVVATLLAGGVPFIESLRETSRALRPSPHRDRVIRAVERLETGGSAFDEDALGALLDPADREILTVAERTGMLAEQWQRVAERRVERLARRVGRLGSILEPLLVVLVGLIVGGAVLALYLPTFRILDLL